MAGRRNHINGEHRRLKTVGSTACLSCKATRYPGHTCKHCSTTAYCSDDCYRADWYRHKFACKLGRPVDATDHLLLSCHTGQIPTDDDVVKQYGFESFDTGWERWNLFQLYRRLVTQYDVEEEELRSAVVQNRLKEMLVFRCMQTRDPDLRRKQQWLASQEAFGVNGKGPGFSTILRAAQHQLLDADEKEAAFMSLRPEEKRDALLFYAQIRSGFKADADDDNWISLGICTAEDEEPELRLTIRCLHLTDCAL